MGHHFNVNDVGMTEGLSAWKYSIPPHFFSDRKEVAKQMNSQLFHHRRGSFGFSIHFSPHFWAETMPIQRRTHPSAPKKKNRLQGRVISRQKKKKRQKRIKRPKHHSDYRSCRYHRPAGRSINMLHLAVCSSSRLFFSRFDKTIVYSLRPAPRPCLFEVERSGKRKNETRSTFIGRCDTTLSPGKEAAAALLAAALFRNHRLNFLQAIRQDFYWAVRHDGQRKPTAR